MKLSYLTFIFAILASHLSVTCIQDKATTQALLPIPPLLEDTNPGSEIFEGDLNARVTQYAFFDGKNSKTFGYNIDYLGPTIKVRTGTNVKIGLSNGLEIPTSIHWHGLVVDPRMDGVFDEYGVVVPAGGEKKYEYQVIQPSATLWYHPHTMRDTGKQAYNGLAGLFIVTDDDSDKLPSIYGVTDIPLVIQDKRFTSKGELDYDLTAADVMSGIKGNLLVVNGKNTPLFEAPSALLRLRLLNGSNASFYSISRKDKMPLILVGSEGGLLEKPISIDRVELSPGERAEVLVDMRKIESVVVMNTGKDKSIEEILTFKVTPGSRKYFDELLSKDAELSRRVRESEIPATLSKHSRLSEKEAVGIRNFELENLEEHALHMAMMDSGRTSPEDVPMTINGKTFDMSRVDENVKAGSTEIWNIKTFKTMDMQGMPEMIHNFHIHGAQFEVLELDGKAPGPALSGLKDTVSLWPHLNVKLLVKFSPYKGKYIFHCHVLEHEDAGMAGTFELK